MNISTLTDLLKKRKVTQRELAGKIGITQTAISQAINRGDFKISMLEKISLALNVPVGYFFNEESEIQTNEIDIFDKQIESLEVEIKELHTYVSDALLKVVGYGIDVKKDATLVMSNIGEMYILYDVGLWYGDDDINKTYKDLSFSEKNMFLTDLRKIKEKHKKLYNSISAKSDNFFKTMLEETLNSVDDKENLKDKNN